MKFIAAWYLFYNMGKSAIPLETSKECLMALDMKDPTAYCMEVETGAIITYSQLLNTYGEEQNHA